MLMLAISISQKCTWLGDQGSCVKTNPTFEGLPKGLYAAVEIGSRECEPLLSKLILDKTLLPAADELPGWINYRTKLRNHRHRRSFGDCVEDSDAFPDDPAASVDTDGDGMPDSWNPGFLAEESTSGLALIMTTITMVG